MWITPSRYLAHYGTSSSLTSIPLLPIGWSFIVSWVCAAPLCPESSLLLWTPIIFFIYIHWYIPSHLNSTFFRIPTTIAPYDYDVVSWSFKYYCPLLGAAVSQLKHTILCVADVLTLFLWLQASHRQEFKLIYMYISQSYSNIPFM